MRHSPSKLGTRLVLLVLADFARGDGEGSWPSVATIASAANLSERQVQYSLRRLERDGEIERTGLSQAGTNVYRVVMDRGGADSAPAQPTAPDPPGERETPDGVLTQGGVQGGVTVPVVVDRKRVTEREAALAPLVLAAWNRATGQSLRSREWVGKIILRLREYPELGLDEHEHIIEVSLARPWWSGSPSPSVIYGSGAQFERQLVEVRTRPVSQLSSAFEVALAALNERSTT